MCLMCKIKALLGLKPSKAQGNGNDWIYSQNGVRYCKKFFYVENGIIKAKLRNGFKIVGIEREVL